MLEDSYTQRKRKEKKASPEKKVFFVQTTKREEGRKAREMDEWKKQRINKGKKINTEIQRNTELVSGGADGLK